MYFDHDISIPRERQLVPHAQQCLCVFCHSSEALPGKSCCDQISHLLPSPDLVPAYFFFLFPEVESAFRGRRFQDIEGIKKSITAELNAFSDFYGCFVELLEKCKMLVAIKGNQFKENSFILIVCVSVLIACVLELHSLMLYYSQVILMISVFRLQHMNNNSVLENAWKTVITVGCVSMAAVVTISRCVECIPFINHGGFSHHLLHLLTVPLPHTVNRFVFMHRSISYLQVSVQSI